jgi:hypothetical protein
MKNIYQDLSEKVVNDEARLLKKTKSFDRLKRLHDGLTPSMQKDRVKASLDKAKRIKNNVKDKTNSFGRFKRKAKAVAIKTMRNHGTKVKIAGGVALAGGAALTANKIIKNNKKKKLAAENKNNRTARKKK